MPQPSRHDISHLLDAWRLGDSGALERLMPLVYDELRRMAARYLDRERRDHTLQTTALVHEVYLKLRQQDRTRWSNRQHFFAISAQMMRRLLVNHAQYHGFRKRGGGSVKVSLQHAPEPSTAPRLDLVALRAALRALADRSPEQARIVTLSYFGGLTQAEVAEVMGLSPATVARRWRIAKVWLYRYLRRKN